jgi:hypothetical protein
MLPRSITTGCMSSLKRTVRGREGDDQSVRGAERERGGGRERNKLLCGFISK